MDIRWTVVKTLRMDNAGRLPDEYHAQIVVDGEWFTVGPGFPTDRKCRNFIAKCCA